MSSAVDNLGGLIERLKRMVNDIQDQYESFIDSNQLYKQGKVNERQFFASIGTYLVAMSSMNFLAIETIFEMKSAIEKKKSIAMKRESPVPEFTVPNPQQQEQLLKPSSGQTFVNKNEANQVSKNCIVCGSKIPKRAKFCSKCGNSQ